VFSSRDGIDAELKFSGFRSDMTISDPYPGLASDTLNRSGQRYQMCYNLKGLGEVNKDNSLLRKKESKIRNATFYHQFDVITGNQLWIFGDQKLALQRLTGQYLNDNETYPERFGTFEQSFKTSLDMHLVYCRWASQHWRWHLSSLEENVQRVVRSSPFFTISLLLRLANH
jgi:hypothetical protein